MSFVYKMSIQKQLNSCDVVICILIYFKYRYSLWQLLCRLLFLFLFFSKYSLWQLSFRLLFFYFYSFLRTVCDSCHFAWCLFLFLFFSKDSLWQLLCRLLFLFLFFSKDSLWQLCCLNDGLWPFLMSLFYTGTVPSVRLHNAVLIISAY